MSDGGPRMNGENIQIAQAQVQTASHSFVGEYLELVPNERIRYTDRFDDPNLGGNFM